MQQRTASQRILFVDDDRAIRGQLARYLRRRGFIVDLAADGEEALELVDAYPYAVVATDLRMPGLDGLQLIAEVRQRRPEATCILVSGAPGIATACGDAGASEPDLRVVAKPWEPKRLVATIEDALQSHARRGAATRRATDRSDDASAARTILLVEDNPLDAELVQAYIDDAAPGRYRVEHVERLADAEQRVDGRPYSMVLLDLGLPDAHELDGLRRLRRASGEQPIVVLTGRDDDAMAVAALQEGAEDYLPKNATNGATLIRSMRYAAERRRTRDRIAQLARFDQLTGLANRATLQAHLQQALARAMRQRGAVSVLFVDVDRFKSVNDMFGHAVGDRLLEEVAHRLRSSAGDGDLIARHGGDEFAIVVESKGSSNAARRAAQRVVSAFATELAIDGHVLPVTPSIGIASFPTDAVEVDELLSRADAAMYCAKRAGGNGFRLFDPTAYRRASARTDRELALRQALDRDELVLRYQPQISLTDGNVVGIEALIRWQRPDGELVPPLEFIPQLEETGLIVQAGEWTLRTACQHLRVIHDAGWPHLRVAVNVSARELREDTILDVVGAALRDAGLSGKHLDLEITENLLVSDQDRTQELLAALKMMRVRISIDDFGKGFSSLAYLHRLAIDALKVDRTFISGVGSGGEPTVARAIIDLARNLKLQVVAEGVETPAQETFARGAGCQTAQGFLYAKPLDYEELQRWLAAGPAAQCAPPAAA